MAHHHFMASYPTPPVPLADALKDAHAPHGRLKGEDKTFGEQKSWSFWTVWLAGNRESKEFSSTNFRAEIGSTAKRSSFFPLKVAGCDFVLKESILLQGRFHGLIKPPFNKEKNEEDNVLTTATCGSHTWYRFGSQIVPFGSSETGDWYDMICKWYSIVSPLRSQGIILVPCAKPSCNKYAVLSNHSTYLHHITMNTLQVYILYIYIYIYIHISLMEFLFLPRCVHSDS